MLRTALVAAVAVLGIAGAAQAQNKVNLRFAVGAAESATDGMSLGMRALQQYAQFKSRGEIITNAWDSAGFDRSWSSSSKGPPWSGSRSSSTCKTPLHRRLRRMLSSTSMPVFDDLKPELE